MSEQVLEDQRSNSSIPKRNIFRVLSLIGVGVVVFACLIALWNYVSVGSKAAGVINRDARNAGISVRAHFGYYVNPSVVVLDVRHVDQASCLDALRVLFSFAGEMQHNKYSRLVLEHHGSPRFMLTGAYFQSLGSDYTGGQNPMYLIRTLPENVYYPNGQAAFGQWTGGWLGVLGKQMEDVNGFCRQWLDLPGG